MSAFKNGLIGVYGLKDRAMQRRLSFEKTTLSHHPVDVFKYLGNTTLGAGSSITDIQDNIFMENTDRRYDPNPITINADVQQMEESPYALEQFGIINAFEGTQLIRVHINSFESDGMGRWLIVGDVIRIPFFTDRNGNAMHFEVSDVDEKNSFEKFYATISLEQVKDSQEMEEIEGIQSNSDALADLQNDLNDAYDATFVDGGLNPEPSLYAERGYAEDGYWDISPTTTGYTDAGTRDTYSPRPNEDFLDNPNAEYF